MKKIAATGVVATLVITAASCSDRNPAALETQNDGEIVQGLVVTDAHVGAPANNPATGLASSAFAASAGASIAYVSAQPGTLPRGILAKITNTTTNVGEALATVTDGGFDPVAIPATGGDKLSIVVSTLDGVNISYSQTVPVHRPPTVVRTNPAKGRIDVALTQVITTVFSEPVDLKSVSGSSIRLLKGDQQVSADISTQDNGLSVNLVPASSLEPQTTYALIVGTQIRDLNGDPLDVADTVTFKTISGSSPATEFELTGVVTADDGTPLPGAGVMMEFAASSQPGTPISQSFTTTSQSGAYTIGFTSAPGSMNGPLGTESAIAFASVEAPCSSGDSSKLCDYDNDFRYVVGTTQNFMLHRTTRITAGDSVVVAVASDDAICDNNVQDMHPWPTEFVCRTVHIVAPVDGVMRIEAVPVQAGVVAPGLEVEAQVQPCCSERLENPTAISVVAGTVVMANVEIPWGSSGTRSFVVRTSMTK